MDKLPEKEISQVSGDVELYIKQMTPQEKLVLDIAREHLESSFDIEKSIGYKEWLKTKR